MSTVNAFTMASALILGAFLIASVFTDMKSRRIPNKLVLTGLLTGACLHGGFFLAGYLPLAGTAPWSPLTGLLAGGAVLMPLYLLRACGAGDVKLMAMVGSFIGAPAVLTTALYTLIAGGLLSLAFMLGRGVAAQTLANVRFMLTHWMVNARTGQGVRLEPLQHTAARLPYAVAISLGTLAALVWPLSL